MKLLLEVHGSGYRQALEMFVNESNEKIRQLEKKFSEKIQSLEKENCELKRSLEFTQKTVDEYENKLSTMEIDIKDKKDMNTTYETRLKALEDKVIQLEDQSRRNNLRFCNVPEDESETWEMTAMKVKDLLSTELGMEDVALERAHRIGPKRKGKHRTIIARFSRFADRDTAIRNAPKLKKSPYYINEDMSTASFQKRQDQMPALRDARKNNQIAYFSHVKLKTKPRPNSHAEGATGPWGRSDDANADSNAESASSEPNARVSAAGESRSAQSAEHLEEKSDKTNPKPSLGSDMNLRSRTGK